MISLLTKNLEMLCSHTCLIDGLFRKYYKHIVDNEIALANINKSDHVLCIGGGPMPCTAMEIVKQTGCMVTVLDNDPGAIKRACKYIDLHNMSQSIQVKLAHGQNCCVKDYSVIHIALQVKPKDQVFKYIWKNCSTGTRILMRQPRKNLEMFYSIINNFEIFDPNCSICQKKCTMRETCLVIKDKENQ